VSETSGTDEVWDASNSGVTSVDPLDPYVLLAQTLADRSALVQLCLYALDRARSDGVAERIERGPAGGGVLPARPDGAAFDPARPEAAGAVPTDDTRLVGLIAETETAGFTDHGRVLRVPVVTVYQKRELM